jgi:GT2 family glycosyltransferase
VVPTHNRARLLKDTLRDLAGQDLPAARYEVIVIDDGSTDDTASVVAAPAGAGPEIVYMHQEQAGLNSARNRGIAQAQAGLIAFVDDDVVIPPSWLGALVDGWEGDRSAGCYGGPIALRLEGPGPHLCGREPLGETELDLGDQPKDAEAVFGANFAVTRDAFERAGPFDESLPIYGEELEWQTRHKAAGGRIAYLPGMFVEHRRTTADLKLRRLLKGRVRRGRSQFVVEPLLGAPRSSRSYMLHSMFGAVRHAVGRRCMGGLLNLAFWYGYAAEDLRDRRRKR